MIFLLKRTGLGAALAIGLGSAMVSTPGAAQQGDAVPGARTATGAYLSSVRALNDSDLKTAGAFMSQAFAHDPSNGQILHRTFILALSGGDLDLALELARRILQIDPADQTSALLLALADAEGGRFAEALERLERIAPDGVARFILPLVEAWIRVGLEDHEGAVQALDGLGQTPGFTALTRLHEGLIYDVAGDAAKARTAYEAARQEALTLRLTQALGALYERTGEPEKASQLYADFLAENPQAATLMQPVGSGAAELVVADAKQGLAEALFQIGSALSQEEADELSLTYLRMTLYLRPDLGPAQILLGDVLADQGALEDALVVYQSVDADDPTAWPARLSAARVLDELEQTDEAVALLEDAAADRPDRGEALIQLGDLYRGHERFEEAVAAYDRALEQAGDSVGSDWSFLYKRGIALERAKQWDRAERDLRQALSLNPDHAHLLNYLGYSLIDRGLNLAEGQAMIEQAVALMPDDGYIVDSLGWAYYRTGQFGKAVETLERAAEMEPMDAVINDHLGDAYWMAGRRQEANFQWRRAQRSAEERDLVVAIERKLASGLSDPGIIDGSVTSGGASLPDGNSATRPE